METKQVLPLGEMRDSDLRKYGWYPYRENLDNFDGKFEQIRGVNYEIIDNTVVATYDIVHISVAKAIVRKQEDINDYRDDILDGGFFWNEIEWVSDERSRQNITGVSTAIANGVPYGFS